jgi:hypothetical protein
MRLPKGWVGKETTAMPGLLIVFLSIVAYSPLTPPSFAQSSCVEPANLCEQWWDARTSRWIQNPDCSYINRVFLQSDTPSSGPSEGFRVNPVGQQCGVQVGHFNIPCGVKTTSNTCAESSPPPGVCPVTDPACLCDPRDPNCGAGDPCDPSSPAWDPYKCHGPYTYSAGRLNEKSGSPCDEKHPCGPDGKQVRISPRGNSGLETVLRRAALLSPLPRSVATLLQELAHANGIYLKATISVVNSAGGTTLTGSYEYWERAGLYRIRLDPGFGGYPFSDIAFDGTFLQRQAGVNTVQIRRGDDRLTPLPDGPLTLALAPLRVSDPAECPACQLRLADLKRVVQWRRDAAPNLAASEGAFLAGTFDAGALRYGESDAEGRLVRLVWPPDQTSEHNRIEIILGDHQPIAGTSGAVFPMRLTARLTPESLTPELSVAYTVEKIDLSPSFRDEVFDIQSKALKVLYEFDDKNGVWHGQWVRYVPTPGPKCETKPPQ